MKFIGKMLKRCSLFKCEKMAEFLDHSGHPYCPMHAQFLIVSRQIVEEHNNEEEFDGGETETPKH